TQEPSAAPPGRAGMYDQESDALDDAGRPEWATEPSSSPDAAALPQEAAYDEDTAAVPAAPGEPSGAGTAGIPGSSDADPYAWGAMGDTSDDERTSITPQVPDDEGRAEPWEPGARPEEPMPLADELPVPDLAPPEEGITLTGSHEMPDWTEPASGEVPAALADPSRPEDDEAWEALGRSARWRSSHDDWSDAADVDYLAGPEPATGALSSSDFERSDPYSFDEDFERLEEERSGTHQAIAVDQEATGAQPGAGDDSREAPRVVVGSRTATRRPPTSSPTGTSHRAARSGGEELPSRIAVGVGLVVLLVIAYALGPFALLVLAAAAVVAAAAETYGILQRSGFRPATLLGLVATAGLMFAGYWRGMDALGLILALTFAATMVWYLLGIVEARPLANVAVTSMAVLWIGFFGGFGALILKAHDGRGLFLGVVAVTVISDIVAYLVGSQLGHRPLAPDISPGKTVEGLVAGTIAALVIGVLVGKELTAWVGIKDGILLGVVVAVLAPIGDLFESLIKRDLNVKDSGTSLGGHGGMLDRFDSLLLVLPGAYFLADYLHLIK
ncbi:MAG TPA: phosphatidate cytidylyltransferase, partial [Acidimicrobiales bacterium]|nr:phosphatidate cytidylyltransferase [Acidimicrobiales bacterium]